MRWPGWWPLSRAVFGPGAGDRGRADGQIEGAGLAALSGGVLALDQFVGLGSVSARRCARSLVVRRIDGGVRERVLLAPRRRRRGAGAW